MGGSRRQCMFRGVHLGMVLYSKPETGKIFGPAFLKIVLAEDVRYGARNTVWLHPVTSLTTEWSTKAVVPGIPSVRATHARMVGVALCSDATLVHLRNLWHVCARAIASSGVFCKTFLSKAFR